MSPTPRSRYHAQLRVCAAAMSVSLMASLVSLSHASDGTWNVDANGNWNLSDTTPWLSGAVAEGSGSTANFTNDISTTTRVVTLTAPVTIGSVVFGDANTATAASWTLAGSSTNTLTLAGAHTITVNALGTNALASITAPIAGTDGLIKEGAGILSLSGASTYTGATAINTGSLRIGSSFALGGAIVDDVFTGGAVTVASGAALQLQNNITVNNTINLNGAGTSSSNRALSLIGGAPILAGAVNVLSNSTIGMGSATSASVDIQGNLNLGANQLTVEGSRPLTLSGVISGTGTLNLANIGGTTIITNDNSATYSGQINVARSTLAVGHNNALGTGTLLFGVNDQGSGIRSTEDETTTRTIGNVVSLLGTTNSTYTYGSTTAAVNGNLTFSNTTAIALGATIKKFQVYNRTQFEAGFTGTAGITMQTGTGTLVLNGNSTYTGATAVNAGTLFVNGAHSTALTATVSVASGARIGGTGSVGNVTFNSGAALAYEVATAAQGGDGLTTTGFTGAGIGSFTVYLSGPATGFDAGSNYSWTVLTSNSTDMASVSLAGITLDTSGFGPSYTGTFNLTKDATSLYVNYVGGSLIPEPSTYSLLAGGAILGLALLRRRRA